MNTTKRGPLYVAGLWIMAIFVIACLTGCASEPTVVVAGAEVDTPVSVPCKITTITRQPDLLAALPATATLTQGMKTCLAQRDYDLGYEAQLEAAVASCQ